MQRKLLHEREEILHLIHDECQDIISEAQMLLIRKRAGLSESLDGSVLVGDEKPAGDFDEHHIYATSSGLKIPVHEFLRRNAVAIGRSVDSTLSKQSQHSTIYPEMLSPEETQELVRSVLERVSINTWNEFQSAYNSGSNSIDVNASAASIEFFADGVADSKDYSPNILGL